MYCSTRDIDMKNLMHTASQNARLLCSRFGICVGPDIQKEITFPGCDPITISLKLKTHRGYLGHPSFYLGFEVSRARNSIVAPDDYANTRSLRAVGHLSEELPKILAEVSERAEQRQPGIAWTKDGFRCGIHLSSYQDAYAMFIRTPGKVTKAIWDFILPSTPHETPRMATETLHS
jgi:hypothetical protein